jgi:hypothetical protein
MVINDLDCDMEDLTVDDFPDELPETAAYVIAQASLARIGWSSITHANHVLIFFSQLQASSTVIFPPRGCH